MPREAGHPIIRSLEPGEDWMWCYIDEVVLEPVVGLDERRRPRGRTVPPG